MIIIHTLLTTKLVYHIMQRQQLNIVIYKCKVGSKWVDNKVQQLEKITFRGTCVVSSS